MTEISFFVHGEPAPQGSKRHIGRGVMVESSKKVKPWRQNVVTAALDAINAFGDVDEFEPFHGPVKIRVIFYFPRPKAHFGTGRNADVLKPDAPVFVTSLAAGDADKLQRSTYDALTTAGIWDDDKLVASWSGNKRYANHETPGAHIRIWPAGDTE